MRVEGGRRAAEALGVDRRYYYLTHDRDSIFSAELDASVGSFGLRVQKTPVVRKY